MLFVEGVFFFKCPIQYTQYYCGLSWVYWPLKLFGHDLLHNSVGSRPQKMCVKLWQITYLLWKLWKYISISPGNPLLNRIHITNLNPQQNKALCGPFELIVKKDIPQNGCITSEKYTSFNAQPEKFIGFVVKKMKLGADKTDSSHKEKIQVNHNK